MSAAKKTDMYIELVSSFTLTPIKNKAHYEAALAALEKAMDLEEAAHSKTDKNHINDYAQTLIILIKKWESKQEKIKPNFTPVDVLKLLMEQNNLEQKDFEEELGNQPTVSKILAGKQELKVGQIERLAKRFKIYPSAFFTGV